MILVLLLVIGHAQWDAAASADAIVIGLGSLNGANGYRVAGVEDGDRAGSSISNAGDVNGDGLDDFIIGAPSANPESKQGAGEVYVIFGGAGNPTALSLSALDGSNGFRIRGADYNDELGRAVSGGDINGDGYADLLIGSPGADPTEELEEAGSVYVIFGRPSFPATLSVSSLTGNNGFRINGIATANRTGTSISNAGDVNGDGFDDVLIGAPDAAAGNNNGVGQAYVVFGKSSFAPTMELKSLNGANGFRINGTTADSYVGRVVNSAGDINGDGYGDFLLTAWKYFANKSLESGTVYVIFGQPTFQATFNLNGINGSNGFRVEGVADGDNSGRAATTAGDVNGDGRDDLIVGAPFASSHTGEAYVIFGRASFSTVVDPAGLNGSNGFKLIGGEANSETGITVAAADLNGDGLQDVLVGASLAGSGVNRFAGKVYAVMGRNSFPASMTLGGPAFDGIQFDGAAAGDQAGQTLSYAGDINGDGYDELLIGAPNAGPAVKSFVGYTYLVQGGATLGVPLPTTHTGTPDNDTLNGTAAADVMLGGRGNDQIDGKAGPDALKGGAGDDVLTGGSGADRLIGGTGKDTASYAGSPAGVTINLFTGAAGGGDAEGDTLRSIEGLTGSASADKLTGDARGNVLTGGGGDDELTGGRGNDAFRFGPQSGHDTITDFVAGPETDDYLDFTIYPAVDDISKLNIKSEGGNTILTLPGGETITLRGVAAGSLHADDCRFFGVPLAAADNFATTVNTQLVIAAPGVLANDDNPSANPLKAVLVAAPGSGKVTLQPSGTFTYTPNEDFVGVDEFTYKADNGRQSNVARVTIDVTLSPPTAVDDAYNVELGQTLTVAAPGVLANDQSDGGPVLQAVLVEEPVDGTLTLNANGSFTYTPSIDFPSQDKFTYRASNGLESNTATVVINILDPDGPPVAVDDAYKLQSGTTLTISAPGVLANDVNPLPGAMTAQIASNPSHGTVSLKSDGSLVYTSSKDYVGTDSFTYRASNGQQSEAATVTLTITGEAETGSHLYLPVVLRQ